MAVISNTFDMFFRAHDYASRVVGNINVSLASQLGTFVQMGYKIPLVSKQISAGMTLAAAGAERYVRELKELQKYTGLNTKMAASLQHAIEQSGGSYEDIIEFTDKLRVSSERLWDVESQLYMSKMAYLGIIDKSKSSQVDMNETIIKAVEYLDQYKEGIDRSRAAQYAFGNAALAPILSKQAEALKLVADRGRSYIESMDRAKRLIEDNRYSLSELTMAFKDLGVKILEVVLPVLTVLVKSFTITIHLITWLAKPILAVLRPIASFITATKEICASLGILGKILIWVAVFALGFYIRQLLLTMTINVAGKITALGESFVKLGKAVEWTGKFLINCKFWLQSLVVDFYNWAKVSGNVIGMLKKVGTTIGDVSSAIGIFTLKLLALIAVFLIVYEAINLQLRMFAKLGEVIFGFFGKFSETCKSISNDFKMFQRDIQSASLESFWKKISDHMRDSRDKAKETGREFSETLDLSKMLFDSLNGVLDRAINLPANVVPAIAQRMEMNKKFFEGVEKASRNMQKYGSSGYSEIGGGYGSMTQGQNIKLAPVNVSVKMDTNSLYELIAREKKNS